MSYPTYLLHPWRLERHQALNKSYQLPPPQFLLALLHPSLGFLRGTFQDPLDTKVHRCSQCLIKNGGEFAYNYTHSPVFFESFLGFLKYRMQCEYGIVVIYSIILWLMTKKFATLPYRCIYHQPTYYMLETMWQFFPCPCVFSIQSCLRSLMLTMQIQRANCALSNVMLQ
jgi:hypothetical protein